MDIGLGLYSYLPVNFTRKYKKGEIMLLTDEEIKQAIQYEDDDRGIVITDPPFYPKTNLCSRKIAKAQLKKVLEYIGDELICGGRLGEPEQDGEDAYFLNAKGWQVLLEEIDDNKD